MGQLLGAVSLYRLNAADPLDFRTPIYTQVSIKILFNPILLTKQLQWAMIGSMLIIFLFLPETPWWLVSKGKVETARKMLHKYNGHISRYSVDGNIVRFSSCSFSIQTMMTTADV